MRDFVKRVGLGAHCVGSWGWTSGRGHKSSIGYEVKPGKGVRLFYTHGKTEKLDYLVRITSTPCNLGGRRYWWLCPSCYRRCRVLYGSKYFVCHKCNTGAYYETQKNKDLRTRIDNELAFIRKRLQAQKTLAVTDRLPSRPKGMHVKTYVRLALRYHDLQYYRMLSIGIEMARLGEDLGLSSKLNAADLTEQLQWLIHERG